MTATATGSTHSLAVRHDTRNTVLTSRLDEHAGLSERAIALARVVAAGLIVLVDVVNFFDHGDGGGAPFPFHTSTYLLVAIAIFVMLRMRPGSTRWLSLVSPIVDATAIVGCAMWSLNLHGRDAFIGGGGNMIVGLSCALLAASGGLRFRWKTALITTVLALVAFTIFEITSNGATRDFFGVQVSLLVALGMVGNYAASHLRRSLDLDRLIRAVFRTTRDAVFLLDETACIVFVNPPAVTMLGATNADALIGRRLPLKDDPSRGAATGLAESTEGRGVLNGELLLARDDGGEVSVFGSATPVRDETGRRYIVLIAGDLSPQVEARRLLERERARLADQVEQHTAELRRTNRELEQALRARDRFLATMSHELRTPLHGILVAAESMAEQAFGKLADNRQTRGVQTILSSGRQLLAQISDILELSRLGSEAPDIQPVAVATVCAAAIDTVRPLADRKALRLRVVVAADDAALTVPADERRLLQILINLLGNAVKFTPAGGEVELSARADNRDAVFEVRDTGPGIAHEDLERMFEPFVQLEPPPGAVGHEHDTEGSGLGLAVVKELVEQHHGRVIGKPLREGGMLFVVRLPLDQNAADMAATNEDQGDAAGSAADTTPRAADSALPARATRTVHPGVAAQADPPVDADDSSPEAMRQTCAGRRIMLVDDHELNLVVLRDYLATIGLDVLTTTDGEDALHRLTESRCDLVVLDMQMPGMDGYELTRRLKSNPVTASMPVVALTAFTTDADRQRSLDAGADAWLARPVSLAGLRSTIAKFLRTANASAR
ncbi:MAG: ATP-binding protein [Planctomycetota bacterium]